MQINQTKKKKKILFTRMLVALFSILKNDKPYSCCHSSLCCTVEKEEIIFVINVTNPGQMQFAASISFKIH